MPTVYLSPIGNGFAFNTAGGAPLSGGLVNTYAAGTSTPLETYNSVAGTVANANPIVLGVDGRVPSPIWLQSTLSYKFAVTDSLGNSIMQIDNVAGILGSQSALLIPVYVPTVGGTANAITLTPTIPITSYANGQRFTFVPPGNNTGAVTVNVSGQGVEVVANKEGFLLTGGELRGSTGLYEIAYSSAVPGFVLLGSEPSKSTSFTPALQFGGSVVGITYSQQLGFYQKFGNLVFFSIQMQLTNKGAAVGNASIAGLPYVISASFGLSTASAIGICTLNNITFADKYVNLTASPGASSLLIAMTPSAAAGPTGLTNAAFANNSGLTGTGFYVTE